MDIIFDSQGSGGGLIFGNQTVAGDDDTPPNVSLSATPGSITTAGTVMLSATAFDDSGVQRVDFYKGAALLGSDTTFPYGFVANVSEADNGTVVFRAEAFDTLGNAASATSNVVVNIAATGLRSIALPLTLDGVTPVPNMTGLKYAWWDAALPQLLNAPLVKGVTGAIANGVFNLSLPNSILAPGAHGCLALTNGNGLSTESPEALVFFGPVPVN